ncbi:MAG: thioredoxin domain-containing protein, partial [Thermoleophilia bacterium]
MAEKAKTPPPPKKAPIKDGPSRRNVWVILGIATAVAVIAAGVLIYVSQQSSTPSDGGGGASAADVAAGKLKGVKEVNARFAGIPQNGNTLGDPAATVTITEYADLRCPACQKFAL